MCYQTCASAPQRAARSCRVAPSCCIFWTPSRMRWCGPSPKPASLSANSTPASPTCSCCSLTSATSGKRTPYQMSGCDVCNVLFNVIHVPLKNDLPRWLSVFLVKCSVTKAWTTSTAWKWRTWCRCTTCCWRCWTPTSCTAPVCLAGHPSRRRGTSATVLLARTAPVPPAPRTPGLPAAPEAEVNRSSRIRIQMQWLFTLYTRLVHCGALLSVNSHFDTLCTNSSGNFSSSNFTLRTHQISSVHCLTTY